MENVLKAIKAERAALNGSDGGPSQSAALSNWSLLASTSSSHTPPTSIEVYDKYSITVKAQTDGRSGFTIPTRFFLGRTYQM